VQVVCTGGFFELTMPIVADNHAAQSLQAIATGFLPDFCANRAGFLLVLIAELLAVVLALTQSRSLESFWTTLALASLFVQWVALMTALVLCRCRRWLNQRSAVATTLAAFGVAQLLTLLCSLLVLWLEVAVDAVGLQPSGATIASHQAISGIVTLLALRYFYMQHQWKQQVQAETRARFQALQARIHPHFLFNTLNTIASLIPKQPDQAEQAVLDLADLLRSALAQRDLLSLDEELELTRRYLAIESLRLGERLRVDWRLADDLPLELSMPALLLQPLVENAIYHGLQLLPEGGVLMIQIERLARALRITVSNPRPAAAQGRRGAGQGLAQNNIRQRLQLAYETLDPLRIVATPDRYQVIVTIPLLG